jgi:5-dehydro-2-deoxygluconokinase
MSNLGYTKPLYILPFDHKTSLIKKLFGYDYEALSPQQRQEIEDTRMMTYEGCEKAVTMGLPKEEAGILTDEEFGDAVLKKSKDAGFVTILTTEKSGQEVFSFAYGDQWKEHIEKYHPTFVKALIRYNPEAEKEKNAAQLAQLKIFTQYAFENNYKVLFEPLIPATEGQLAKVSGDKTRYDTELRPALTVQMIKEFQDAGVETDVWKIEGFTQSNAYEHVVKQATFGDSRKNVGIVILGRGGSMADVDKWITEGAKVNGVLGFAVGRTVFYEPLEKYVKKEIEREQAVKEIADNFYHFYTLFKDTKSFV